MIYMIFRNVCNPKDNVVQKIMRLSYKLIALN